MIKSIFLFIFSFWLSAYGQKPRLVIGIVVDQMSQDYLYRFEKDFGEDGFRRLMQDGFVFHNHFYNYMPTFTGPGHATIYTGTTPSGHGIAGNAWFERVSHTTVYCVEDSNVQTVGENSGAGKRSPVRLTSATITDMLKLSSNGKSKVIGIALKDRSAILPVGGMADAAYWWDDTSENWITSNFYIGELPEWVSEFNRDHPAKDFLGEWKPVDDSRHTTDHNQFEQPYVEDGSTAFPYDLKKMAEDKGPGVLKSSPFGDEYTFSFAKSAIEGEKLGADETTDFLSISFSSPDYIGHQFGPYSDEVRDTYLRFDSQLAEFLGYLEEKVGTSNFAIFLTGDHGVMPNVEFLKSNQLNAGRIDLKKLESGIETMLKKSYGDHKILIRLGEGQVILDHKVLKDSKIKRDEASRKIVGYLMDQEEVQLAISSHDLLLKEYHRFPHAYVQNGYHKDRSGDVIFVMKSYLDSDEYSTGAGHGTPYIFDTHVPLIFYGNNYFKQGEDFNNRRITQIVPTLSDLLSIQRPPLSVDESLYPLIRK